MSPINTNKANSDCAKRVASFGVIREGIRGEQVAIGRNKMVGQEVRKAMENSGATSPKGSHSRQSLLRRSRNAKRAPDYHRVVLSQTVRHNVD